MNKIILTLMSACSLCFADAKSVDDSVAIGSGYANQIWYSLENDEQGSALNSEWDLAFSKYTAFISNPYGVTGVLCNSSVTIAETRPVDVNSTSFDDYPYTTPVNTIGYDWKKYDYDAGSFIIYPHMNYIINDRKGFYYKLHLIDFYDQAGNKGNPKWEYQKL